LTVLFYTAATQITSNIRQHEFFSGQKGIASHPKYDMLNDTLEPSKIMLYFLHTHPGAKIKTPTLKYSNNQFKERKGFANNCYRKKLSGTCLPNSSLSLSFYLSHTLL
jgi:hypothetical protein